MPYAKNNGGHEVTAEPRYNRDKLREHDFVLAPIFLAALAVFALVVIAEVRAAPTLARLSFLVPPERMAEFETVHREKVVPILKQHGLVESSERGWANEVVSQHWPQSAEAIKEAVIADVRQHIGEQEVYDDITLVVLKQK
ncbi:MAG: hypothetical protein H8E17_14135 [Deltaproteobacteria bacterium]|nr:hypothetical protein [Deltaproteobacteria bacterium]